MIRQRQKVKNRHVIGTGCTLVKDGILLGSEKNRSIVNTRCGISEKEYKRSKDARSGGREGERTKENERERP